MLGNKFVAEDRSAIAADRPWVRTLDDELRALGLGVFRDDAEVVADRRRSAIGDTADETDDTANDTLNDRQQWFLRRLRDGEAVRAQDLAQHFNVSLITAKRDLGQLTAGGWIRFTGPTKTGSYRLVAEAPDLGENETANETAEPTNDTLNDRQRWFLERIECGADVRAQDLVEQFKVSLTTARRDIGKLRSEGWIRFGGGARTGTYRLQKPWSASSGVV